MNKSQTKGKETNTQRYLDNIKKYKLLTAKEENELATKAKDGDNNALRTLTEHNLRLVVCIAKNYTNNGIDIDELIQEGNIGLIEAAERFTPSKGAKFSTYAAWWIKAKIIDYLKRNGKNKDFNNDDHMESILRQCENANADFEEKIQQTSRQSVEVLMECLREREKKILTLFYGLGDKKAMSLKEIKKETKLTTERIRQIKETAITKLRCNALEIGSAEFF